MNKTGHSEKADKGEFLLARVLDAEKAAELRISAARAEAELIAERAQVFERQLTARTDKRVQALYAGSRKKVENYRRQLMEDFATHKADRAPAQNQAMRAAAGRLALDLIKAGKE